MDFIERLFHFSPDGGSGGTEAVFFVIALMIVVVFCLKLFPVHRNRSRRDAFTNDGTV